MLIDNWRWSGVPIYVRVGKRLPKSAAEIAIEFKPAPHVLFNRATERAPSPTCWSSASSPTRGVSLRIQSKLPGAALRVEPVKMDFQYGASFGKASPEAYERLLLDAMSGDPTLFARRDEVEQAWQFVDAIEQAWHRPATARHPALTMYPAGSWGPSEADELIERDGRKWRRL